MTITFPFKLDDRTLIAKSSLELLVLQRRVHQFAAFSGLRSSAKLGLPFSSLRSEAWAAGMKAQIQELVQFMARPWILPNILGTGTMPTSASSRCSKIEPEVLHQRHQTCGLSEFPHPGQVTTGRALAGRCGAVRGHPWKLE